MTDDSNHRYRSGDPYGQQPAPDDHSSDPLAELARLIGKSDAFHRQATASHQHGDYQDPQAYENQPAYDDRAPYDDQASYAGHAPYDERAHYGDHAPYGDRPSYDDASGYREEPPADHAPGMPSYDAPFEHQSAFGRDARFDSAHVEHEEPEWQAPQDPAMDRLLAAVRLPLDPPPQADQSLHSHTQALPPSSMADPLPSAPPPLFDFGRPAADAAPHEAAGFANASFGAAALPEPGSMPPPNHDEYYDDAPASGRRRGLVTVFAVLALAVLGTGAAYGYRTFFGGPTVKSPPPVIRASAEPNKVAPPPQPDAKEAAKISYDRFADRGQNEQIVVREEKPVDVGQITRSGPPSPGPGAAYAATPPAAAPAQPAANPPSVLTEPKRVRTVPVRPDAPDPALARQQLAAAIPAPPVQRSVPQRQVANAPLDLANPQPQARAPAPPPPVRTASRPPEPPPGTAPLSLAPDSRASAAAPERAAPRAVANGNYLVQLSSQRSEADAQAAFRSLRSKYSSLLGSHNPVIRRADLAGRGTYYRAMVGPFASRNEAAQLCSSLKAAGGDCVVQSN